MPRIYQNTTLGYTFPLEVSFSTPEEYNQQKGDADAWFNTTCSQECYGGWNTSFRSNFVESIEQNTGVKRNVRGYKGADNKTPILETEGDYLTRIQSLLDEEGNPVASAAQLKSWADEAAAKTGPLTASPGVRGNRVAKPFIEEAERRIALIGSPSTRNPGQVVTEESIIAQWEAANGLSFSAQFGGFNVDSLARAVKFDTERRAREANAL